MIVVRASVIAVAAKWCYLYLIRLSYYVLLRPDAFFPYLCRFDVICLILTGNKALLIVELGNYLEYRVLNVLSSETDLDAILPNFAAKHALLFPCFLASAHLLLHQSKQKKIKTLSSCTISYFFKARKCVKDWKECRKISFWTEYVRNSVL